VTKVFHPNVWARLDEDFGKICLDTLDKQWSPAYNISKALLCVQQLLESPNPDDALDTQVSEIFF
jgi:ubiquitin-protein ligase